MKQISTQLLLTLFSLIVLGTAHAEATSRQFQVKDFERIKLSGDASLVVEQGKEVSVRAFGEPNILERVSAKVRNGQLHLTVRSGFHLFDFNSPVKFQVLMPQLKAIESSGSGDVVVKSLEVEELRYDQTGSGRFGFGEFAGEELFVNMRGSGDAQGRRVQSEELKVDIRGSGDFTLREVETEELDISIFGSGDVVFQRGRVADRIKISIKGSGDVDLSEVVTPSAKVSIYGSGTAQLYVEEELDVNIYGSGDVYYKGNAEVNSKVRGSGSTRAL